MKLAVYDDYRLAVVEDDRLYDITQVLPEALDGLPQQRMNWLIAHWEALRPQVEARRREVEGIPVSQARLLPPSPHPSHLFAAPANYRKHVGELGVRSVSKGRTAREQGFFLKAPGSLVGAGNRIVLPKGSTRRFDHESELAVIIGRAGRNVPRERAMEYVFGYSCLIDATMRIEPGVAEEERSMRKSFATFTPLGPFLVTADEVPDAEALGNRLWVNDTLKQDANTGDMIVGIAELIELISSVLPISPGDVIATGTPEGVGPFAPGDRVRIAIEGVGDMRLEVVEAEQRAPRAY
ncbi:fumarylacetoacetate hydrolase family protein [Pseudomonas sp. RIT-PI-AD]|uniref:fumarylacetoacetate hydrolase family protein n=1 Tax=Pseudomonas sp. RIT-PI-AD TaxID=3035294 RepID=UPI0021D8300E|nr:fumarylacetoacetate hydrolase family protein [Pseudomonas sp. RIT-PI-AD]